MIEYRFIVKKNSKKFSGGENSTPYNQYLNLLFQHDVVAFIDYINQTNINELDEELVRYGLFNNPSRVATRICEIYRVITPTEKKNEK